MLVNGYKIPKYDVYLYDWKGGLFATDSFDSYKECKSFFTDYYNNFVGHNQKMYIFIWNHELGKWKRRSKYKPSM